MEDIFNLTEESYKNMDASNRDRVIAYIKERDKVLVPDDMSEDLGISPMDIILILCGLQSEGGIKLGLRGSVYFVFELSRDIVNGMADDDLFGPAADTTDL